MILKQRRLEKGMTTEMLARFLNLKVSTINSWENGIACPRWDTCEKYAKFLGLTIAEVLNAVIQERNKKATVKRFNSDTAAANK